MPSGRKSRLRGTSTARRGAACARGRCVSTASASNLSRICHLGRRVACPSNTTQCKATERPAASPIWTTSFSNSVRNHCEDDKAPHFVRCIDEMPRTDVRPHAGGVAGADRADPRRAAHCGGGGSQSELFSQWVADEAGCVVMADPVEATAAGNVLLQALAMGQLTSPESIRGTVHGSFAIRRFEHRPGASRQALGERPERCCTLLSRSGFWSGTPVRPSERGALRRRARSPRESLCPPEAPFRRLFWSPQKTSRSPPCSSRRFFRGACSGNDL